MSAKARYPGAGTTTLATTPPLRQPIRSARTKPGTPPIVSRHSASRARVVAWLSSAANRTKRTRDQTRTAQKTWRSPSLPQSIARCSPGVACQGRSTRRSMRQAALATATARRRLRAHTAEPAHPAARAAGRRRLALILPSVASTRPVGMIRRNPALVATPDRIRSRSGTSETVKEVAGGTAAQRQAGAIHQAHEPGREQLGGVPRRVSGNRKTGTRWLHGRSVRLIDGRERRYPSIVREARQRCVLSSRNVSEAERVDIGPGAVPPARRSRDRTGDRAEPLDREPGDSGATATRRPARTAPSTPTARPPGGDPGPGRARSRGTQICAPSWAPTSSSAGARSRLAPAWSVPSRTGRTCASRPRRSTRRSTHARAGSRSRPPRPCGRAGGCASRAGGRTSGDPGQSPDAETSGSARPRRSTGRRPATGRATSSWAARTELPSAPSTSGARATFVLMHLSGTHGPERVRDGLIAATNPLPRPARALARLGPRPRDAAPLRVHQRHGHPGLPSATRRAPGSAAATRTPMGCCDSTSPRARTCARTAPSGSPRPPPSSTAGRASPSAGTRRPNGLLSFWRQAHESRCCDDRLIPPDHGGAM